MTEGLYIISQLVAAHNVDREHPFSNYAMMAFWAFRLLGLGFLLFSIMSKVGMG